MQHPDEGTIHAWIDGELAPDDAAALEAHLAECPECSALVAEARGLVAASSRIVSALDIIPGDVIPKTVPPRRPWFASTQLRAAAAVVIVAGASLLVARNGEVKKMERAVRATAPSQVSTPAAEPMLDSASNEISAAPVPSAITPARTRASDSAPQNAPEKALEGKVAGVRELKKETANDAIKIAAAPPPAPAVQSSGAHVIADQVTGLKPEAARDSARNSLAQRRRFNASPQLDQVVVTGVATLTAPMPMKKLRADSTGNVTIYEVSPGVEVTLVDNGLQSAAMLRASAQSKEKQMAMPPPSAVPAPKGELNSISWTDKRGHLIVLMGPFSKEVLENLRQRLPLEQR
ncbi:MAG TPA: zf-HC2 domain-containing protein [Gemmatimonadaceae bacterium]|nr:zf-HC2 domain-containing protein [Gemmatimonadaceae bacterium]